MLNPETPYPYPGSYAFYIDRDGDFPAESELVRIQWRREGWVMVAFPLRRGAGGNKVVPAGALIDPTPLDAAEERELADLGRHLEGRERLTPKMKRQMVRMVELKRRLVYSRLIREPLAKARDLAERQRRAA